MRNLLWFRATTDRYHEPRTGGFDRYDPSEIDPPEPFQVFARLGLLLVVALAFGLAAELLARLPLN
jgi:hypothetical protein